MKKVFLYLYPIKEYTSMFLLRDEEFDAEQKNKKMLLILNECIQKRYRDNGYQVVIALFPDKGIFGLIPRKEDKIIYTNILFSDFCGVLQNGNIKKDFIPKYPDEQQLIEQLGKVEQLVLGGYHFSSCVKRVGEVALAMGINTLVDLDLTDLFFNLYNQKEYFDILEYRPEKFKEHMLKDNLLYKEEIALQQFNSIYSDQIYGFDRESSKTLN